MTTTATKARSRTHGGDVEVCCHTVSWWFDIGRCRLTDRLADDLEQETERRAGECIRAGYWSGELCYLHLADNGRAVEMFGWWRIDND